MQLTPHIRDHESGQEDPDAEGGDLFRAGGGEDAELRGEDAVGYDEEDGEGGLDCGEEGGDEFGGGGHFCEMRDDGRGAKSEERG